MDKLQPLIRNQFWILAGLVIPLVLYGYYSANSQLKAATKAREETLEKTKSGVSPGNVPNEDYIKKLKFINGSLETYVDDAIVELWKHQQARMTWPSLVASRIPADFLADFDQQVPFIYKGAYEDVYRRLMERVQPVRPMDPMVPYNPKNPIAPNQKVILMAGLPQANFGQFGITSQEMWDAQIDVWMTELLLDAIVEINRDKESVRESVVRRLDILQLLGGSGEPVTADASAGGEMGGMDAGMEGMGGGMRMGASRSVNASVAFDPKQEFGPAVDTGGGGEMMGAEMDFGGGAAAQAAPRRYIGDPEALPYFERGFYMSVIIQQNKIPDFIVQLANSDWPIQVRRFQVGANPYRTNQVQSSVDGFQGGMNEFNLPTFEGDAGGIGAPGDVSPESGFNPGVYASGDRTGTKRPNPYSANLPPFVTDALNHPDLVRLDLCGVITMYKQPKEVLAAVETRRAMGESGAGQNPVPQAVPANPPADAPTATPESAPATSPPMEGAPSPEGTPTPPPASGGETSS